MSRADFLVAVLGEVGALIADGCADEAASLCALVGRTPHVSDAVVADIAAHLLPTLARARAIRSGTVSGTA